MEKVRVKTPVVLQMEAAECGAASLGIILGYYKKFLSLEQLRGLCSVSRNGSDAGNILFAAESLGIEANGYPHRIKPPFIIHRGFHHFLVCEGWNEKKILFI